MEASRERILERLRAGRQGGLFLPSRSDADIFTWHARDREVAIATLAEKLTALKAEFHRVPNTAAAAQQLKALLQPLASNDPEARPQFLRHAAVLLETVVAQDPWLQTAIAVVEADLPHREFASYKAGITTVEFLVARTGSLVVSSAGSGGRRLSVLPPFHLAIATVDQVTSSLEEALAGFHKSGREHLTSVLTIITGPSRTADIEKILVLGAHGPRRLAVILIG
ncbi:MAG: LUD domain-containing protein [candidate division KSB1 bacterium]|nr:LUD domain-containing protein [candidate division KSB1 bacterium]MDZ7276396.1 LUD domain-containing protein [candidate division KSB1 bacterium]MDZ7288067.1 LUD domain-containing protein [candidate division KSB1 bacterium]MDZ7300166.1 LUD domain-containing protein [candidate division KSB1 bacterium]MDZ7308824.1 LUD domain-containing protein [candidate division KSB1 bacterium]